MIRRLGLALIVGLMSSSCVAEAPAAILDVTERYTESINLPEPGLSGTTSLETALTLRRSEREFASTALPLATIGQLLWAAQGVTNDSGNRTAPSAGALYPLELYVVTETTFMHYLPDGHRVEQRLDSTSLSELSAAAFGQEFVSSAPAVIVISGVRARTEAKYGAVGADYVNREAGHAAQNLLLQASVLNLAAVPVGGFDSVDVERLLALPLGEQVLYLIPFGDPEDSRLKS